MRRANGTQSTRPRNRKRVPERVQGATARPGAAIYNERGFLPLYAQTGARKRVIGPEQLGDHYGD